MKKITTALALAIAVVAGALALSATSATPASAATDCFKTVSVDGRNAYGWATPYSWSTPAKYVRTAPSATFCLKYAKAYGGYYVAGLTCGHNSARLTSDPTELRSIVPSGSYSLNSGLCRAAATWKWYRTVANDQCARISSSTRWNLNQGTGAISLYTAQPVDDDFVPASC